MHKRWFNQALIEFVIQPAGPILVKANESQATPGRPDIAFVRTLRNGTETVYLPGSSLKGVLRAHCEQIVRGMGDEYVGDKPLEMRPRVWSCDPLDDNHSCSERAGSKDWPAEQTYREACFICRMFGHTNLAGRVRTADAYPESEIHVENRDGVAIDRFYGSVEIGPFTYEVAVGGNFCTRLMVYNFTLAQLGLLMLSLRDLKRGRVSVGYGKGRGLGRVTARIERFAVRYPACELRNGGLHLLGHPKPVTTSDQLAGVGAFVAVGPEKQKARPGALFLDEDHCLPLGDVADLPNGLQLDTDDWGEVQLELTDTSQIEQLWTETCVPAWSRTAELQKEETKHD